MTPTQEMIEAGRRVRERQRAERYQNEAVASDQSVDEEEARELYLAMEAARLQSGSPVSEAEGMASTEDAERAKVFLGPFLAREGLAGRLLNGQAAAVYDAAINAIASLQAPAAQPTEKP